MDKCQICGQDFSLVQEPLDEYQCIVLENGDHLCLHCYHQYLCHQNQHYDG